MWIHGDTTPLRQRSCTTKLQTAMIQISLAFKSTKALTNLCVITYFSELQFQLQQ
jgi:hypothetical protein